MKNEDKELIIQTLQRLINTIESDDWEVVDGKITTTNDLSESRYIPRTDGVIYQKPYSRGRNYKINFYLRPVR